MPLVDVIDLLAKLLELPQQLLVLGLALEVLEHVVGPKRLAQHMRPEQNGTHRQQLRVRGLSQTL